MNLYKIVILLSASSKEMATAYSLDLRQKAMLAYEKGEGTQEEIAERFSIGLRTFQEWLVLKRETGTIKPKDYIYCGRKPIIGEEGLLFIKDLIKSQPDILISAIRKLYKKKFKVKVAQSMVSRALKHLNLRRKKKSVYAQEQAREDVKKKSGLAKGDTAF